MASTIPLYVGIFIMIIIAFFGLSYLTANYSAMSKDIVSNEKETMGSYLKTNIVIENITINPADTVIYVYNNGSVTLTAAYVDLYINGHIVARNETEIHVIGADNDEFWIEHYNISITYNKTLQAGDSILVVCENGKKSRVVI